MLIDLVGLNWPRLREFRELWIRIVQLAPAAEQDLYRRLLSFPDDLPDLKRLRPPAATRGPRGSRPRTLRGVKPAPYPPPIEGKPGKPRQTERAATIWAMHCPSPASMSFFFADLACDLEPGLWRNPRKALRPRRFARKLLPRA
jgi:hypothetical protein